MIEFPVTDKRALRDVFKRYDIRGVFNLASARAADMKDKDYVMRRNAVDFGVPLFMEPKVCLCLILSFSVFPFASLPCRFVVFEVKGEGEEGRKLGERGN